MCVCPFLFNSACLCGWEWGNIQPLDFIDLPPCESLVLAASPHFETKPETCFCFCVAQNRKIPRLYSLRRHPREISIWDSEMILQNHHPTTCVGLHLFWSLSIGDTLSSRYLWQLLDQWPLDADSFRKTGLAGRPHFENPIPQCWYFFRILSSPSESWSKLLASPKDMEQSVDYQQFTPCLI